MSVAVAKSSFSALSYPLRAAKSASNWSINSSVASILSINFRGRFTGVGLNLGILDEDGSLEFSVLRVELNDAGFISRLGGGFVSGVSIEGVN